MEDVILVRNIYRDKNVFTVDHRSAEKKKGQPLCARDRIIVMHFTVYIASFGYHGDIILVLL